MEYYQNVRCLRVLVTHAIIAGKRVLQRILRSHVRWQARILLLGIAGAPDQRLGCFRSSLVVTRQSFRDPDCGVCFLRIDQPPESLLLVVGRYEARKF
jgi:hypothetical protein